MYAANLAASQFPPVTVFGLPLHPLVVHVVVVLLPLAAIGGILMAFWVRFSKRFGPLVIITAWAAFAGALAAAQTGQQLQIALSINIGNHGTMGGLARWVSLGFAVIVSILGYLDWRLGRPGKPKRRGTWEWFMSGLTVIAGLVSIYWIILVGHSGAKIIWGPIGKLISGK